MEQTFEICPRCGMRGSWRESCLCGYAGVGRRPTWQRWLDYEIPRAGWFSWLILSVGQIASVIGCVTIPFVTLAQLQRVRALAAGPEGIEMLQVHIVGGAVLGFILCAAMAVVFALAKWIT